MRAFTPKGWQRPIITDGNPNLKGWRQLVATTAQQELGPGFSLLEGGVRVQMRFFLAAPKSLGKRIPRHTKKPDLSKLIRAVEDALTGVVWRDDAQVDDLAVSKRYATNEGAGVFVVVEG
jgi:crossover junction endodeoxyribonuclease RusA